MAFPACNVIRGKLTFCHSVSNDVCRVKGEVRAQKLHLPSVPRQSQLGRDFLYNARVEKLFSLLSPLLTLLFVIGMAGCLLVIPLVAYKLFRVLFEDNSEDEPGRVIAPRA